MSAWIVDKEHVDVLVTALIGWEFILPEKATETGRMLWRENVKSIHSRYPDTAETDDDYPGPNGFHKAQVDAYEFELMPGRIDPWVVDRAVGCYNYQSCEHGGWDESEACRLMTALRELAKERMAEFDHRFGQLNDGGFDSPSGAWGYASREVFADAEARRGGVVDA